MPVEVCKIQGKQRNKIGKESEHHCASRSCPDTNGIGYLF